MAAIQISQQSDRARSPFYQTIDKAWVGLLFFPDNVANLARIRNHFCNTTTELTTRTIG
jgi:hypothetical protein